MSRLLFAAARGARIQYRYPTWVDPDLWDDGNTQLYGALMAQARYKAHLRIHPDDEHLQYGPISSALRKSAIEGTLYAHANIPYIMGEYDFGNEEAAMMLAAQTQRGVFKLILAEALADEGL